MRRKYPEPFGDMLWAQVSPNLVVLGDLCAAAASRNGDSILARMTHNHTQLGLDGRRPQVVPSRAFQEDVLHGISALPGS